MRPVVLLLDSQQWKQCAVQFYCPGCNLTHTVTITPEDGVKHWSFNGNLECPTLSPSLGVRWRDVNKDTYDCHVVVTDGVLNYCTDSEHELAGQKVAMLPVDEWPRTRWDP